MAEIRGHVDRLLGEPFAAPLALALDVALDVVHVEGERKRRGGGTYRPPLNSSLFVHNLKGPSAFSFAWEHMQEITKPYDHARCLSQVKHGGRPVSLPAAKTTPPRRRRKQRAGRRRKDVARA